MKTKINTAGLYFRPGRTGIPWGLVLMWMLTLAVSLPPHLPGATVMRHISALSILRAVIKWLRTGPDETCFSVPGESLH